MSQTIELLSSDTYASKLAQCIHCGLCLQACPTYAVFSTEMDGPRGRIALMRAAASGQIAPDAPSFVEHIDRCLGCRACETACPSGVEYGALIEHTRLTVEAHRSHSAPARLLRWLGLRQLMPHPARLKLLARLAWLYQHSGLQPLVRRLTFLPAPLRAMEAILPPIDLRFRAAGAPAPAVGPQRGRVAFLAGCIQEAFLAGVNAATIRVLQQNGYEVIFPPMQTCCGAAQLHSGELELARDLARRNIDACLAHDVDAIIMNAGGCGQALKEYGHLLRDDPSYATRVAQFVAKVQDISEFLATRLVAEPRGAVPLRATYADSCHLRHGQKIVKEPRALLRSIPGLDLVELRQPDRCCGSAGTYNITQPETANAVLDAKMADIASTGAELIIASNTGCHMQYIAGARRAGLNARVMHVVEVLDLSYRVAAGERAPAPAQR